MLLSNTFVILTCNNCFSLLDLIKHVEKRTSGHTYILVEKEKEKDAI